VEAHNLVLGYNPRSSFTEFNFAAAFFGLRLGARLNIFFPTTAPALFFGQVLSSLVSVRINHCLCFVIELLDQKTRVFLVLVVLL
jgi:hypothetical protein